MSKNFNPFSSSSSSSKPQGAEKESQLPTRLLQLAKPKEKKDKKKKKGKGEQAQTGTMNKADSLVSSPGICLYIRERIPVFLHSNNTILFGNMGVENKWLLINCRCEKSRI